MGLGPPHTGEPKIITRSKCDCARRMGLGPCGTVLTRDEQDKLRKRKQRAIHPLGEDLKACGCEQCGCLPGPGISNRMGRGPSYDLAKNRL